MSLFIPCAKPPIRRATDLALRRICVCALLLGSAVALGACKADECPSGERRCRGNVAESCVGRVDNELWGHTEWTRTDCGGDRFCTLPPEGSAGLAFCALDSDPDPACPPELRSSVDAERCEGNVAIRWTFGFRVAEEVCVSGSACADVTRSGFDPACVDIAFCSPLAGPDPLCTPGVGTACQDATTIVHCQCGFRQEAHACMSPGPSCVLVDVAEGTPPQGACR